MLQEDRGVGKGKLISGLFPLPSLSISVKAERGVCPALRIRECSWRLARVSMPPTTQRIIHVLSGQRTPIKPPSQSELERHDYNSLPAYKPLRPRCAAAESGCSDYYSPSSMMTRRWMRVRTLLAKARQSLSRHRCQRYPWAEFRSERVSAIYFFLSLNGDETDWAQ